MPTRGSSTLLAAPYTHTEARVGQDRPRLAFAGRADRFRLASFWGLEMMLLKHLKQ